MADAFLALGHVVDRLSPLCSTFMSEAFAVMLAGEAAFAFANALSLAGWLFVLSTCCHSVFYSASSGAASDFDYTALDKTVLSLQGACLVEESARLLGHKLTKGPASIPFIFLWLVIIPLDGIRHTVWPVALLIAWSIAQVVRYFYLTFLSNNDALRRTQRIVLIPAFSIQAYVLWLALRSPNVLAGQHDVVKGLCCAMMGFCFMVLRPS